MLNGEIKGQVNRIWDAFWSGGISNPLTVIEQITYLLFIKRLDEIHTRREEQANFLKRPIEKPIFNENQQNLRWSKFKDFAPEEMFETVSLHVFPFMKNLHADESSAYFRFMKDAVFMIPTPNLLDKVVAMISNIPMDDRDTKGDLYEYLLSKIAQAGTNGQFRTPRHIIKMMVDLMQPKPTDVICDPAAGTAGFLVSSGEYLHDNHKEVFNNKEALKHYNNDMFYGIEFDASMIRIGAMNMLLHGIENPNLEFKDSLGETNSALEDKFTLVLANPPFKGSLDEESVAKNITRIVKTKKTELLFIALFLRMLKTGGRCACIVPDGVLFGSSNSHKIIRQIIVEKQKLEAIISMPSGVFKPYAGVSTAIIIFSKTNSGGTDKVWFYDMLADGFSLDDRRTELDRSKHENDNIQDIVARYRNLKDEENRKRTEQSFFVPIEEIRLNDYDLSINRYKTIVYEEKKYCAPTKILEELNILEQSICQRLDELEQFLK